MREREMTWRHMVLGLAILMLVAACSGAEPSADEPVAAAGSEAPSAAADDSGCGVGETDGELRLFNWT
jgi:hypothetical protein